MSSPYGKRGGPGKTAGRKATTYEATMPDGTTLKRRSFEVASDEAYMAIYQHNGVWYSASVVAPENVDANGAPIYHGAPCPSQTTAKARRLAPKGEQRSEGMKPNVHAQGTAIVERNPYNADELIVMLPDGTVAPALDAKDAEKRAKKWFGTHMNDSAINVAKIEWRDGTKPPEGK